ncbi:hypothetical protein CWO04_03710 [Vibrio splendidus]|uniref:hypothetical protein n=1 Tax=Vibrio splendidus TaxID=29497 RepID=UPI0003121FA6|nr:hypothetical protein [Vibrio splendidus]OEF46986.1 hypothetical protein A150_01000 [Vibrio splendidus 1S-124]PMK36937.1 hypothetical protein BCU01_03905 [Vibrio splendidus]PTP89762.1 hypothetical protein CWO04_03710 [Vibrio splendidus]PTQ21352.1 hypothetical protein CWO14_03940 [Vibrio splendidus]
MKHVIIFVSLTFSLVACTNVTHVETGKQILLLEKVSNAALLTSYQPGVYEQMGMKDGYELYRPVAAETTNYVGSQNRYIAVKEIGDKSEVCIPDSLNFFWCAEAQTKLIK